MPRRAKSRRVAAQQTQQGQKKKKPSPGPSGISAAEEGPSALRVEERTRVPVEGATESPRPQPVVSQRPLSSRQTESRISVYNYVRPEIKRIMTLSAAILVIIIVLSFVLR